MHLKSGTLLQGGKYKIEKVLGQGGFGITYLAIQSGLGRKVAIKEFFLKEICGRDESTYSVMTHVDPATMGRFKTKFLKEARTLMSFNHPNIVHVYDCFEENNTAYYVMEYVEGSTLSEILRQGGTMNEQTAVGYVRKVAEALNYIHSRNINHLDVKPGNILLRRQDLEIVLIDFGTAKHYDTATGGATTMTQAGYSQGYAAIEQYRQGGVGTFTPETDIYSLGATLYKLITGQTPPEPAVLIENGLPPMPSTISANTRNAIIAAMQINKASRPHSINEFVGILEGGDESTKLLEEETLVNTSKPVTPKAPTPKATSPSTPSTPQSSGSSTPWGWIVAVLIVVVGGIVWIGNRDASGDSAVNASIDSVAEEVAEEAVDPVVMADEFVEETVVQLSSEKKEEIIKQELAKYIQRKPSNVTLSPKAKSGLFESTWPEIYCNVEGYLESPTDDLWVDKIGEGRYRYSCICSCERETYVDNWIIYAICDDDGMVTITEFGFAD